MCCFASSSYLLKRSKNQMRMLKKNCLQDSISTCKCGENAKQRPVYVLYKPTSIQVCCAIMNSSHRVLQYF